MIGLLLVVWLAAPGISRGLDNDGPQNLLCYKPSCGKPYHVNCSWEAGRNPDANYTLHFWYHDKDITSKPQSAGKATFVCFHQDTVYPLKNVTIWVESHVAGRPLLVSDNLTLQIHTAFKFVPPSRNSINFSRVNNTLTLLWPKPKECHRCTMKKEARIKPRNNVEWTLKNCTSDDRAMEKLVGTLTLFCILSLSLSFEAALTTKDAQVKCHMGENIPYEAQIRFRTSDWSSLWSDWSEAIFIPAEILESPKVDYTIGQVGNNGLRNVTLEWEKPNAEYGDVHYNLTFKLLPCNCEEAHLSINLTSHQTSYQTALSSAGYDIFLEVTNEAGTSPVHSLRLPPAQYAGPRFLNVSLSGRNFTLTWEAKVDSDVCCFEKQPLGEVQSQEPCKTEYLNAMELHESSDYEANASETHYTILNLQHKTNYRVGVWAYTTGSKRICKARVPFLTSPPDPKKMALALSILYLFGGILVITGIFHFGKKRLKKVLCPALPDPANAEALKIFTRAETIQVQPQQGLLKFLESSSLIEPFTVEVLSAKEEPTATTVDSPDLMKAVEEPMLLKEARMGSGNVLPSEYKGQWLLNPLEDDCNGKEGFGEFAGLSPEMGTGCSLLFPDASEAGDSQDLPLPLAPLSFRLLNKLVVIKNGNSSCDFP
ncbi:hypothetical protein lerEdw1_008455 [Lerista edwardsae]|nr:hypothetical protein lerEdw1_008455 [Lerista edwardsae]